MLFDLFITFAKLGAMSFGGGYAMLPLLIREIVQTKGWASEEELIDYFAIGQTTPGIIAVNTATMIGQKQRGILGGIVATLGLVFPSVVIISALATVISAFSHLEIVQKAFNGIKACVCVLIINGLIKLVKKAIIDRVTLICFLSIVILSLLTPINPVFFVIIAAIMGILLKQGECK